MDKLLNIGPETTNFSNESHNLDYEFDRQLDEVKPLVIKLADKNCKSIYIWFVFFFNFCLKFIISWLTKPNNCARYG